MQSIVVAEHPLEGGSCLGDIDASNCEHIAYCTQACLDRAQAAKAQQETAKPTAAPNPQPASAETRLEKWRREHKGYEGKGWSSAGANQAMFDRAVQSTMCARGMTSKADGCEWEHATNGAKPDPWTPREVDMDIPDAHELGGTRLGR